MGEAARQLHNLAPPEYAILGEQPNTFLRLVASDGKPVGNINVRALESLITKEFPDQTGDFLILKGFLDATLCDQENGPHNLDEVETDVISKKRTSIIKATRARVMNILPSIIKGFGEKLKSSENPDVLAKDWETDAAKKADRLIELSIEKTFIQSTHSMSLKEEVKSCKNAVRLMYMAMDKNMATRIRFEAKRKLALMVYFARLRMAKDKEKQDENIDHDEGLDYLVGLIDRKMSPLDKDAKIGEGKTMIIESLHDENDGLKARPNATRFLTEDEAKKDFTPKRNKKRTSVQMRTGGMINEKGEQEEILFHFSSRDKSDESIARKRISQGREMASSNDMSGIRMIFKSDRDTNLFFKNLKSNIQKDIEREIDERIESDEEDEPAKEALREAKGRGVYNECVKTIKDKYGRKGEKQYEGDSLGSSEDYQVRKIEIEVIKPDENGNKKKHIYEFQILLPHEFVDYFNRVGTSWREYEINRFFVPIVVEDKDGGKTEYCSMAQLLFPEEIYEGVKHEELRMEALESIVAGLWAMYAKEKPAELMALVRKKAKAVMAKVKLAPQQTLVEGDKEGKRERRAESVERKRERAGNTSESKRRRDF